MKRRHPKTSSRSATRARWRHWAVRLGVLGLFAGLTVLLMLYARSISPEASAAAPPSQGQHPPVPPSKGDQTSERPIDVVRRQLVEYSGRSFPVALAQTHQWGQAYPGGIILLDSSVLTEDTDIMAFKYAHEWAHQVLGHVRNTGPTENLGTVPSTPRSAWGSPEFSTDATRVEDEADAWAAKFLAAYGYNLEAVAAYLREVPYNPTDATHSSGKNRATAILEAAEPAR